MAFFFMDLSFSKHTLKIFWQHAIKYRWQVASLVIGLLVIEALQIYTPILYRDIFNLLSRDGSRETIFPQAIKLLFIIAGLNLLKVFLWRIHNFLNNYFQPRVMADLTNTCYRYLQKHSYGFFSGNFVGSLVTKVKRYERSFEVIADQIYYDLGRSLIDTGFIVVVLFLQYRIFGWIVFAWCMLFLAFSFLFARFKLPYDIKRAAADTKTTAHLADGITSNINIKLFTGYESENRGFQKTTQEQFALRKKSWDLATWGDLVQSTSMVLLEIIAIYYAVVLWKQGVLLVGDIVLLQSYLFRMFDKLWNTGKNIRSIYESLADANEMTEMLLKPHSIQDAPNAKTLKVKKGRIDFKTVDFGYHKGLEVLKDFNLSISPGERVALIGPSGGGKSTIVKLLFRFYDLTGGEILVDGQNIAAATQDSLRANMSLVPQEPILFHRTLMENIRYARPEATEAEAIKAAKLAHAHEFISSFPEKYNTLVGERGVKLSGGERQRVAIARAILKDAPVLVLDEATSSLDSESEMFIQDALKKLMKNRTTIVIAHRLSTIMQMDRIVVIDGGKIVEQGKHEELLKAQQGLYQKLWDIQAGGFTTS